MRRAILLLALVGCGGVSGTVDENGCPTDPGDWQGTATLSPPACDGAPATIYVPGGQTADGTGPMTGFSMSFGGYSPSTGMCIYEVGAPVSCGRASYILQLPAR